MLKKTVLVGLSLCVTSLLMAEPNVPVGNFKAKLAKMAGKKGEFNLGSENFPKDYFLVSKNLPFLAGLTLHHPKSSTLGLSQEQISKIEMIKKKTVPPIVKKVKDIKMLEMQLAKNIAIDSNTPQSQYKIVDAISQLRTELTKAHLECINNVRAVLTKEQYKKLLDYAKNK
jgi:hypothetical protein